MQARLSGVFSGRKYLWTLWQAYKDLSVLTSAPDFWEEAYLELLRRPRFRTNLDVGLPQLWQPSL
jgi:hypothetical protein